MVLIIPSKGTISKYWEQRYSLKRFSKFKSLSIHQKITWMLLKQSIMTSFKRRLSYNNKRNITKKKKKISLITVLFMAMMDNLFKIQDWGSLWNIKKKKCLLIIMRKGRLNLTLWLIDLWILILFLNSKINISISNTKPTWMFNQLWKANLRQNKKLSFMKKNNISKSIIKFVKTKLDRNKCKERDFKYKVKKKRIWAVKLWIKFKCKS